MYPFDESTVLEQTTDKLDMVLLRIVSKDHSAASAGDSTVLQLRPCVKVACYLKDDAVQVMRGTEVRIPLCRDDYDKVSICIAVVRDVLQLILCSITVSAAAGAGCDNKQQQREFRQCMVNGVLICLVSVSV